MFLFHLLHNQEGNTNNYSPHMWVFKPLSERATTSVCIVADTQDFAFKVANSRLDDVTYDYVVMRYVHCVRTIYFLLLLIGDSE